MTTNNVRRDIVPANLAVKAMRDNGYKNIAYAIAELIDNSIQAGLRVNEVTKVELLCCDKTEIRETRRTTRIDQIAVLDNGCGMKANELQIALQFGNGAYLDPKDHSGIGRFGMGLPSSSISQCQRVEVYSWVNGVESALYSYLDLNEIISGKLTEVPQPKKKSIPELWRKAGKAFEQSGTLVVWSKIDRSLWRTSQTIIEKSDFLIGRIYRRFLHTGQVSIRYAAFEQDTPENTHFEAFARSNDPLYLMSNTSCPAFPPHISEGEPMFELWGEPSHFDINFYDATHRVTVTYSIAKNAARVGHNPGAEPHGKHAARNIGVSIVRADRELELDPSWTDPSDPRDRWWGVELDFPPALDDLFGVTNNKQSARYFSDLANTHIDDLLGAGLSMSAAREQFGEDGDPRMPLFEIAANIQKNVLAMRRLIQAQTKNSQGRKRYEDDGSGDSPEAKATKATQYRKEEGYFGESDRQDALSPEERVAAIQDELERQNVPELDAREMAAITVRQGFKYQFSHSAIESSAFFDVKIRAGTIIIALNTNHPAYSNLIEVLEGVEQNDESDLRTRLNQASDGLRLLLSAWARYEDEQPSAKLRTQVQDARLDWGRVARRFLQDGTED